MDHAKLSTDKISQLLQAAQDAFLHVRPVILERAGKDSFTDKQDGSPVTDTDLKVEKLIQKELSERFPDVPVYGEETGYEDGQTGAFWLIDPIDGTQSFIQNIPAFTSMAVLIDGGEAVGSVIYNVSLDDMYVAQKGRGAFKNGTRIDLTQTPLAAKALCKARFFEPLDAILAPKNVTCANGPVGGGFGFTLVLNGEYAARFNLLGGGYTHDYAPGALLVREAGGGIVPIQDDEYHYTSRSFVACHPALTELLTAHKQQIKQLELDARSA